MKISTRRFTQFGVLILLFMASALAGAKPTPAGCSTDAAGVLTCAGFNGSSATITNPAYLMPHWRFYEFSSSHVLHIENNDNLVTPHGMDLETEPDFTEFNVFNTDFAELGILAIDRGSGFVLNDIALTTVVEDFTAGSAGLILISDMGPIRFAAGGIALGDESWNITTAGDLTSKGPNRQLTVSGLAGSGNAQACVDSTGKLYRGSPGC